MRWSGISVSLKFGFKSAGVCTRRSPLLSLQAEELPGGQCDDGTELWRQAGLLCDDSLAEVDEIFESQGGRD